MWHHLPYLLCYWISIGLERTSGYPSPQLHPKSASTNPQLVISCLVMFLSFSLTHHTSQIKHYAITASLLLGTWNWLTKINSVWFWFGFVFCLFRLIEWVRAYVPLFLYKLKIRRQKSENWSLLRMYSGFLRNQTVIVTDRHSITKAL